MPVFYFDVDRGGSLTDKQGLLLNNVKAAQNDARLLGTAIDARGSSAPQDWTITVTDEQAHLVYEIRREP